MSLKEIEEEGDYWVLWKNKELEPVDIMNFKSIKIEWGRRGNIVKIRRIFYPKEEYSILDIKRIWGDIGECPYCLVGYKIKGGIDLLPFSEKGEIENKIGEKKMVELTGIFDRLTKNPKVSELYGGALIAGLTQVPIDLFLTGLGSKLAKGIVALGTALGAWKTSGRISDELMTISAMYVSALFDPSPEKIAEIRRELEALKGAIKFGDSSGVLNALVREDISKVITQALGTTAFSFSLPKFEIPKDLGKTVEKPSIDFF